MRLLLAFIAVPMIEIYLFIQIGGAIGTWPTLLVVLVTAVLGTYLVRSQGRAVMMKLQSSFSELNDPTEPLAHGAMILFAGALLLTPGFFTDAVGFALMVPQFRSFAFEAVRRRVNVQSFTMGGNMGARGPHHPQQGDFGSDVIDGDFEEVVEPKGELGAGTSGWTKH